MMVRYAYWNKMWLTVLFFLARLYYLSFHFCNSCRGAIIYPIGICRKQCSHHREWRLWNGLIFSGHNMIMQSNQQSSWPPERLSTYYRVTILLNSKRNKKEKKKHIEGKKTSIVQLFWFCAHRCRTHTSFPITSKMQVVFTYGIFISICWDVDNLRSTAWSFIVLPLRFVLFNTPWMLYCPRVHSST